MPKNIEDWKTKKIGNFTIPYKAFFEYARKEVHPIAMLEENGDVTMTSGDSKWSGDVWSHIEEGEIFEINSINCSGKGSGATMMAILEPAFKKSTGELQATCTWGGIDYELTIKNGVTKWDRDCPKTEQPDFDPSVHEYADGDFKACY